MKSRKLLTLFLAALMAASMAPAAVAADEQPEPPAASEPREETTPDGGQDAPAADNEDETLDINRDETTDDDKNELPDSDTDESAPEKPAGPTQVVVPVIHKKNADPSTSSVLVNGSKTAFDAYTIDGFTYFKLRDIAAALTGTPSAFDVQWNDEKFCIELTTGKDYAKQDGDLTTSPAAKPVIASSTKMGVILNGAETELSGYSIEGNTYFQLRDLGEQLGFAVDWNAAEKSIAINAKTPEETDPSKADSGEAKPDDASSAGSDTEKPDDTSKTERDEASDAEGDEAKTGEPTGTDNSEENPVESSGSSAETADKKDSAVR